MEAKTNAALDKDLTIDGVSFEVLTEHGVIVDGIEEEEDKKKKEPPVKGKP